MSDKPTVPSEPSPAEHPIPWSMQSGDVHPQDGRDLYEILDANGDTIEVGLSLEGANAVLAAANPKPVPEYVAVKCECRTWATTDFRELLMGNGHNPQCPNFVASIGALALISALVNGINSWASQEDGVPEELWGAYSEAFFITNGYQPDPKDENR